MYSLNVPVPSAVARRASELARRLPGAVARPRGEHTLVCKRLGSEDYPRLEARVRDAIAGQPPFEVRVDGVDVFARPASGRGPVVYLTVTSRPLERLHERLCDAFDPVAGMEGVEYVPHLTIARGGTREAAATLVETTIEPLEWQVTTLEFWDADGAQPVSTISLPA